MLFSHDCSGIVVACIVDGSEEGDEHSPPPPPLSSSGSSTSLLLALVLFISSFAPAILFLFEHDHFSKLNPR